MDFATYERERRAEYAAFAAVVGSILTAAIRTDPRFRLQQVKDRAKAPASLKVKLNDRGLSNTTTLESDIKDLAGCRVIFYTNADVRRFIESGLIQSNFDILEIKLHHPSRETVDANELFISNNYLVKLRPERLQLPEYARFGDMRCEVQIQTILNHAWAEMAHDTIYKAPTLAGVGANALDAVKRRLAKIARKYLLPAGYEFEMVDRDFQRLLEGKAHFDRGALEAIVVSEDNNSRAEALETLAENVLPYYDDIRAEYPQIVEHLIEAVKIARTTPATPIETPGGLLPAKTVTDVVEGVAAILDTYRYIDADLTFDALCQLFTDTENAEEREFLLNVARHLSRHELKIWRTHGPVVQSALVDRIDKLPSTVHAPLWRLLTEILSEVLKSEVTGTTSRSNAVTFHQGAVMASDSLKVIRRRAMGLLKTLMPLVSSDDDRLIILSALEEATRTPHLADYSNELARVVIDNTRELLEYQTEIAPTLTFEILQTLEHRAHLFYTNYRVLPTTMASDSSLVEARNNLLTAALAFRDTVNADRNFVTYKTLVGFESVFPPAWDDVTFGYTEAEAYRTDQVEIFLGEVDGSSAEAWFQTLSRCAQTQSNDAATFPTFVKFLTRLGQEKPDILIDYIERMEPPLARFLPWMLVGLMKSSHADMTNALIEQWLNEGRYLSDIARYLRDAETFDETLLHRVLDCAIANENTDGIRNALIAAEMQFRAQPGSLIENVFLRALRALAARNDLGWVRMSWFSWRESPILLAMNEDQAGVVLEALVPYPRLELDAEHIVTAIAARWPEKVIDFLERRQAYADSDRAPNGYRDLPFRLHDLRAPLAAALEALVTAGRRWFETKPNLFRYGGGHFLAAVFPDLPDAFRSRLAAYVAGGDRQDIAFVLSILREYEGQAATHDLVKDIVAQIGTDDPLRNHIVMVLSSAGIIAGEYGVVERYRTQKAEMEAWLTDPREPVRLFAESFIRELDRSITNEQQSADASIALRKLEYGEELDGEVDE